MSNRLPCEIVQDLLPSYMDGLTSEVTNAAIEEHIAACDSCRDVLYAMRSSVAEDSFYQEQMEEKKEIDFLKKTRRRSVFIAISCVIAAVVIAGAAIFVNAYLIGEPVDPCTVACSTKVEGKTVTMTGHLLEEGQCITKIGFEEEAGVVTLYLEGARDNKFNKRPDEFVMIYDAQMPFTQIKLCGQVVWENGVAIDGITADVYETKHDYVGDMSANGQTANALGIYKDFEYLNELQTTEAPYGWIFLLQEAPVHSKEETAELMEAYAAVLFATIGNLDVVTFENPDGSGYATFTSGEVSQKLGIDVKKSGESLEKLQSLMEQVGLAE